LKIPQQAERWLHQQNQFITQFVQSRFSLTQREIEFLAEYYALNRQQQMP
jgi:hypothetical protein